MSQSVDILSPVSESRSISSFDYHDDDHVSGGGYLVGDRASMSPDSSDHDDDHRISRSRSRSSSRLKSRICYVSTCAPKGSRDIFRIYIIESHERSQLEFNPRTPSLRINAKYFDLKSFCIFGSKLFMFDPIGRPNDPYKGRRVLTYKIPSRPLFNYKVKDTDVYEAPFLNHGKIGIDGVTTPDGKKLVVFSTRVRMAYGLDVVCREFEMYDPSVGSWLLLPGISAFWRRETEIHVEAHCIIKNVLLFQTSVGFFGLDMDNPDQMMKHIPCDVTIQAPPRVLHHGLYIAIASHDLYLTPYLARDIGIDAFFDYPNLHPGPLSDNCYRAFGNITLMRHVEGKNCIFCISRGEISKRSKRPRLIVNIYNLDLVKYSEEMEKKKKKKEKEKEKEGDRFIMWRMIPKKSECLPGTKLMKTYKFRLSKEKSINFFNSKALFSIY